MKHLVILLTALLFAVASGKAADTPQSLEEINKAAREQIIRELKLSPAQRKNFEPIYTAYRTALEQAIKAETTTPANDEKAQKGNLKTKLNNISATAQVKRDYVDRFAEVLTAEQIRMLYNAEGVIGTNLHRMDAQRNRPTARKLRGSGRMVTQDRGAMGLYTGISAGSLIEIKISPTATSALITADDNVIDYVELTNSNGQLQIRINAENIENISVSVVLPASTALARVTLSGYSKLESDLPLKAPDVRVSLSGGSFARIPVDAGQKASLTINGYANFVGDIRTNECRLTMAGGASAEGNITCSGDCYAEFSGYSKFSGTIRAASLTTQITGGASVKSPVTADNLTLTASGYAKFSGTMTIRDRAGLSASGGASISGTFSAKEAAASASGYGKIALSGTGSVNSITASVDSGASFSAPELRVTDYRIIASGYGNAEVWCSGKLMGTTASGANITYSGPTTQVEITSDKVRRQ